MFVLLNLKDDKLSSVVQLLFSHGHQQLSIGETIQALCPTCEESKHTDHHRHHHNHNNNPATVTSSTANTTTSSSSRTTTPSTPPVASTSMTPSSSSSSSTSSSGNVVVPQSPKRDFVCSTPIKSGSGEKPLKRPMIPCSPILPYRQHHHHHQSHQNHPNPNDHRHHHQHHLTPVKEEPICDDVEDPDVSGDAADDDLDDLTLSQALELFDRTNFQEPRAKKAKTEEPFGELYQCQLCKKSISRHGQYANLLNHLSRHARLHASKKQYCCPKCGASFTRRYLASTHIKETHGEPKLQPHDFAAELREEYRRLLEMCFPGADTRRKQQQAATQATKDSILSILSDDSGVSLADGSELNISVGNEKVEVHVGGVDDVDDSS